VAHGTPLLPERERKPFFRSRVGFTILAVVCSPAVFLPLFWVLVIGPTSALSALGVPRAVVLAWFAVGAVCSIGATVWVLRRVWQSLSASDPASPRA
jgi:HAMP domain-containing protein